MSCWGIYLVSFVLESNYSKTNKLKAVNLSQRMTRIKRSDLDKLFEIDYTKEESRQAKENIQYEISDC